MQMPGPLEQKQNWVTIPNKYNYTRCSCSVGIFKDKYKKNIYTVLKED